MRGRDGGWLLATVRGSSLLFPLHTSIRPLSDNKKEEKKISPFQSLVFTFSRFSCPFVPPQSLVQWKKMRGEAKREAREQVSWPKTSDAMAQ